MPLTIYDISKKAGVSIATVSRVLNGSDNVRPSTRKKVLDVIEKYDYTPNVFARGMGLHTMHTIGILCADSSDLFLAKAVYYIEQELQANDYQAILCCTGYKQEIRKNCVNLLLSKKIDALILVGSNFVSTIEEDNQYIKAGANQIPVMILNASFDYPNVYSITCDDFSTMFDATCAMLKAGISDILYLYNSYSYSGQKKLGGFKAAMEANHKTDYEDLICFYDGDHNNTTAVAAFLQELSNSGIVFHGIIASEDALAIGAVKYAQHADIRIPEDLSVMGYNNSILTGFCSPELTSIDNQLQTQTHHLVQTLLDVLSGKEVPQKSVFSGKLVERGTTHFLK